jgi:hypothetical protein
MNNKYKENKKSKNRTYDIVLSGLLEEVPAALSTPFCAT